MRILLKKEYFSGIMTIASIPTTNGTNAIPLIPEAMRRNNLPRKLFNQRNKYTKCKTEI